MNIKQVLFFAAISVCFSEFAIAQELARSTEGTANFESQIPKYRPFFEIDQINIDNKICSTTVTFHNRNIEGHEIITLEKFYELKEGESLIVKIGRLSWKYVCYEGFLKEI